MTRDYRKIGHQKKLPNVLPSWAWMLLGIFLGLISSSVVFWQYQNNHKASPSSQAISTHAPTPKKSKNARFDFYHVLPTLKEEEVVSTQKDNAPQKEDYIIQAGSFRQMAQAQELKAQLTLLGLEPQIQTIKITAQDIWYRVYLGPFDNRDKALHEQKQLEQAYQIHSLVLSHIRS